MLQPKRVKYRKTHRGIARGSATGGAVLNFGDWGLKGLKTNWITARQIEAARRAIVRRLRRGGQVWIRIFPDKPVTQKPAETRQGSGKGNVDHWVAVVKRGRLLFEIAGVDEEAAKAALRLAAAKLPIPTTIVGRADYFMAVASSNDPTGSR